MTRRPGPIGQVVSLLVLRWRMVRSPRMRATLAILLAAAVLFLLGGSLLWASAPPGYDVAVGTVLTVLLLTFPLLAMLSGIAAGGGVEIVPSAQLVAFPVSPYAVYLGSLVTAPLNAALFLQATVIVWLSTYVAGPGASGFGGAALGVAYVSVMTIVGLAASWLVSALRSVRTARVGVVVVLAVLGAGVAWTLASEAQSVAGDAVVDAFSTLVVMLLLPPPGVVPTAVVALVVLGVLGMAVGLQAARWTMERRSDEVDARESARRPRRGPARSPLGQMVRTDLLSVWRSRPVRRGILLLSLVPGAALALTTQRVETVLLVPPLLSAGAALLFGINAFALDGGGAVWLESLPRPVRAAFWSKALTTAVVVLGVTATASTLGMLGQGLPTSWETLAALVLILLTCSAWATATGMRQSLRRPVRADMRRPRDAPAPPVVMTLHSIRLVGVQLLIAMLLVATLRLGGFGGVLVACSLLGALATLRLAGLASRWGAVDVRTRVVAAVSEA